MGSPEIEPLIREFCPPARQACKAGGNGIGMRIKRGEHMSYPHKFEDNEARPPRLSARWRAGMAVGPRANSQVNERKE